MTVLKRIDIISAARMYGVINLILGFIIALLLLFSGSVFGILFHLSARLVIGIGLLLLVLMPIAFLVAGFLVGGFEALVYNVFAKRFGYVNLSIKKNKLVWIDPISASKLASMVGLVVGFIVGAFLTLVGFTVGSSALAVFGIISILAFMVFFAVVAFAVVAIFTVLYNYISSKIGSIGVYFKGRELKKLDVYSYAKISGAFGAIWGFLLGISSAFGSLAYFSFAAMPRLGGIGAFSIIVFPIMYFVVCFLVAAFAAVFYNWLVPRIGGVQFLLS